MTVQHNVGTYPGVPMYSCRTHVMCNAGTRDLSIGRSYILHLSREGSYFYTPFPSNMFLKMFNCFVCQNMRINVVINAPFLEQVTSSDKKFIRNCCA